ncbi:tetratricopeptide repeat protein [Amycolatopsis rubida]|uniref:AAA ATPase domain-containing protein n=1 Tax=Amycolatopsis rubida TaxID=112413 RepID=A0A1I5X7I9_9PSEU|nr:tetratricopeptide repeat protein [Amycolatopsis rubida]SFQ27617.1 AAA ATPase domain-containing protein [Amycolatopsis rubida]
MTARHPPVQLPPAPPALIGRDAELARLEEIASRSGPSPALAVVTGVTGIGKTALATTFLHTRLRNFPDGILVERFAADCSDDMGTALYGFLLALGVPMEEIPAAGQHRASLFRTLTADRRFALLLDNAARAEHVRALLPSSARAVVLVTSQSQLSSLARDGADILPLRPLPPERARELLVDRAGPGRIDPEGLAHLVAVCQGHPLKLAIAAGDQRTHPARSPRTTASHLIRSTGDTAMHTVFEKQADTWLPDTKRLHLVLGCLPGPRYGLKELAAAAKWEEAYLGDRVRELVEVNYLDELEHDDVVEQPNLVREDAADQADKHYGHDKDRDESRLELLRGYLRAYRQHAASASASVHPYRPPLEGDIAHERVFATREEAMAWWLRHGPMVYGVAGMAGARRWNEDVWRLAETVWGFVLHTGDYKPFLALCQAGLEAAELCGDPLAIARMHLQIGFLFHKLGQPDLAVPHHDTAYAIAVQQQHGPTLATALSRRGRDASARGDCEEALEWYRLSAAKHRDIDKPRGEAMNRRRCGEMLILLQRPDEAEAELVAVVDVMESFGDITQVAETAVPLAGIHAGRGDYDTARALLTDLLPRAVNHPAPLAAQQIRDALAELDVADPEPASAPSPCEQPEPASTDPERSDAPRGDNPATAPDTAERPHDENR